jgi:hypothetical protein
MRNGSNMDPEDINTREPRPELPVVWQLRNPERLAGNAKQGTTAGNGDASGDRDGGTSQGQPQPQIHRLASVPGKGVKTEKASIDSMPKTPPSEH